MNKNNLRSDCSGATVVEFSLLIGLCLFLVFTGFQLIHMGHRALTLNHTANTVLRQMVIGPPEGSDEEYSHVEEMEKLIKGTAIPLGINITDENIQICPEKDENCLENNTGEDNELVVIKLSYHSDLLFVKLNLSAIAVGRNEDFS